MIDDTSAITVSADASHDERDPLADAVTGWLDAKAHRSQSAGTLHLYSTMLADFAAHLALIGLRLDSADLTAVADAAQAWAGHARRRAVVARSTYNNRLAVLSSFYTFAVKRGHLEHNPIDRIDRATVQDYAGARPLSPAEAQARLAAIDRTTLIGARDYALLLLALYTGRRASELAALNYGDLKWTTIDDMSVEVTWRRTKGGKSERNVLRDAPCEALWQWLNRLDDSGTAVWWDRAPLWLAMSPHGTLTARRLAPRSLSLLCERRIGTSKTHTLRHTFAKAMEESGAKVSEIQAALGHKNIATTGAYLHAMHNEANPYAARMSQFYGLEQDR